jgi:membrane protein YqaA with SNARE-associated domain
VPRRAYAVSSTVFAPVRQNTRYRRQKQCVYRIAADLTRGQTVHFQQLLKEYLQANGYWVLFAGTFLEGEAILIMAGFLAFQGYLNIGGVILTSFVGSFLGDQCYFYLGHFKGKGLLRRFHPIARKFREALRLIGKYGSLVAFFSRYTYGFRIVLPIILGITSQGYMLCDMQGTIPNEQLHRQSRHHTGRTAIARQYRHGLPCHEKHGHLQPETGEGV